MTAGVVWPEVLESLLGGRELTPDVARAAVECILTGEATSAQIAGFLVAMRGRGERPGELIAMLEAVRVAGVAVELSDEVTQAAIDIVGTGGDGSASVNLSTMAALVVAGAGIPVCKHGNRASSSACGAADVLEALGVAIELSPAGVAHCVEQAGIGFCFAPRFHPAFRFAGPTRKELGIRTAFNLLGPLANPAGVHHLLVGAASIEVAELLAQVLAGAGVRRAWVVHGPGGLDELSTDGANVVFDVADGTSTRHLIDGDRWGLLRASVGDLRGGDPHHNAAVVRRIMGGEQGPIRDAVVFNAAAALVVAGAAAQLDQGITLAQQSLDTGAAALALNMLVRASNDSAEPAG
jgi:anthranilate phosphoribosyltransferase